MALLLTPLTISTRHAWSTFKLLGAPLRHINPFIKHNATVCVFKVRTGAIALQNTKIEVATGNLSDTSKPHPRKHRELCQNPSQR
ncbi:hypothetical protein PF008_g19930 [Phytophthora fragariae]|uniref:Uncharacterized protein n=1 Tax=Phytophthora fragariae TaxID=53985 RepID=A0A6G0R282_9STRA|nr:hypothetical protein PF008_g19930 [Phytophthora fragariae]